MLPSCFNTKLRIYKTQLGMKLLAILFRIIPIKQLKSTGFELFYLGFKIQFIYV